MASTNAPVLLTSEDQAAQFQEFEKYDWDADDNFQRGLAAILGPEVSPDQGAELTLRARCFYYARERNINIDYNAYKAWKEENEDEKATRDIAQTSGSHDSQVEAGLKFSYQDIVEMIQSGKPIPGVKDIPNTVLEGQGTSSSHSQRRKPWEKAGADSDAALATESAD